MTHSDKHNLEDTDLDPKQLAPSDNLSKSSFQKKISQTELEKILNAKHFKPEELLSCLKKDPRLDQLLQQRAVREGYSIEEHTLTVLIEFEKYFAETPLPTGLSRNGYRLLLLLHDIGKGLGDTSRDQHPHTISVVEQIEDVLPIPKAEKLIIKRLIDGDAIGGFLQNCVNKGPTIEEKLEPARTYRAGTLTAVDLEQINKLYKHRSPLEIQKLAQKTAQRIQATATQANLSPREFLNILVIYYQADTLAYTHDAARDCSRSEHLIKLSGQTDAAGLEDQLDHIMQKITACGTKYSRIKHELIKDYFDVINYQRDYARVFPSLDYLYTPRAGINLNADPLQQKLFCFDYNRGRLQFSTMIERAFASLEREVNKL